MVTAIVPTVTTNAAMKAYDTKFAFDERYRTEVNEVQAAVDGVSLSLNATVSVMSEA
jgi:flagellar capping protein FliD